MASQIKSLKSFLWATKWYWLTPVLVLLVLLAILFFANPGTGSAPFIYSSF